MFTFPHEKALVEADKKIKIMYGVWLMVQYFMTHVCARVFFNVFAQYRKE